MVGLFLHLLLVYPFLITCTIASVPLLKNDIDPTYFWFRNYASIPPTMGLCLRLIIVTVACFHGSFVFVDAFISMVAAARAILLCLKTTASPGPGKSVSFSGSLLKYRQLSVVTTVTNQGFYYILPTGLFVVLVVCCVSAYFVIKLSSHVPLVLSLFSVFLVVLVVVFAHVVIPMLADVTVQARNSVFYWKRKACSGHRKRQLRSVRALGLWAGPFFALDTHTRGTYLELVMYNSISLVMSI